MRYGMMIELDKCVGCQACVTACVERWDTDPRSARDWVMDFEFGKREEGLGMIFYPGLCNHCEDHPCTTNCPTGATYMNDQGIVVVDADVCIGCGNCIEMCPYGARHADPQKNIVEKCNFCEPYVARGELPACVQSCLAECRHFGDLDDPNSDVSIKIRERQAQPLFTKEINVNSKVYYAPADMREELLKHNVVRPIKETFLTTAWQKFSRPLAKYAVPPFALLVGAAGLLYNVRTRLLEQQKAKEAEKEASTQQTAEEKKREEYLFRHRFGLRVLHWFNAISWVLLLATGTALMIAPSFALFGTAFPQWLSNLFGGQANLIRFHVYWGLLWTIIIIPFFLYFKEGGFEALREIRLTKDDMRWMIYKPLYMVGLAKNPLPPQDKYNAGQKLFALSALVGTSIIILSGFVMAFHWGSPQVVRLAILTHKLAILFALFGLAVHITMAAIMVEERPALKSMITGYIDKEHALSHSTKWVLEVEEKGQEQSAEKAGENTKKGDV